MNILVTGATGFVGRFLCSRLLHENLNVYGTLLPSESPSSLVQGVKPLVVAPLGPTTQWAKAIIGIDIIIHLAARVHVMNDIVADPLAEYMNVNAEGTAQLAYEAVKAGVKRFVYISSIKVNGEESVAPYTLESLPNPTDPYGISKWQAELNLRKIEAETGLEVVILRPTLIYGPGVKANFLNMMKVIKRGLLLPLASIKNKRSLIYVGNFVDALATCAVHPSAAGKTFLVSDGVDLSTPELIRRTASALGVSARLFPFPTPLMHLLGKLTGKSAAVNRLTGSLTVDSSFIILELGWEPPITIDEGLYETAQWFNRIY